MDHAARVAINMALLMELDQSVSLKMHARSSGDGRTAAQSPSVVPEGCASPVPAIIRNIGIDIICAPNQYTVKG